MEKERSIYRKRKRPFFLGSSWQIAGVMILISLMIFFESTAFSASKAQVRAIVDRNRVAVGESVSLTVTIEGADGDVDVSGINTFKVISRGSTSSYEFVNGRSSRKNIYNYLLLPLKEGKFEVPSLPVEVDGKTLHTDPITIEVQRSGAADKSSQDLFLKVEVSDQNPYQGQPFSCTFTLYNAVQIAEAQFHKPDFKGFSVEEIENQNTGQTIINGREYYFQQLTYVLTAHKTGKLAIDPAQIQCKVLRRSHSRSMRSPFDDFFGRTEVEMRIIRSDPLALTVKSLPPVPQGEKFSGLVGKFELSSALERTDLTVGDSVTYSLTLSGNGNLLDAPDVRPLVPEGFKHYDDSPQEDIRLTEKGYQGRKIFRTALVPVKDGKFTLPKVNLTYFDVEKNAYKTLESGSIDLTVKPSAKKSDSPPTSTVKKDKNVVTFTGRDILPLKEDLSVLESQRPLTMEWYLIWLVVPAAIYFAVRLVTRRMRKGDKEHKRLVKESRDALKAAKSADCEEKEFLSLLYRALVAAIRARSKTQGASLTWSEAEKLLKQSGFSNQEALDAANLLTEIETANYSGGQTDQKKRDALFTQTRSMVGKLL